MALLKKTRGVKTRCGDTWSESRYFSFIRSALRRAWCKYPPRYQVLDQAKRKYEGPDKRTKWEYQCQICTKWHKTKNIEVDHIESAGSLTCFDDLPGFVSRLFCEIENLRVLCKQCHLGVTNESRQSNKS